MVTYVNTFFEERVEHLVALAKLVEQIFAAAQAEYRIAGGLATYLYVEEKEPDAGRLTKDIDIAVRREDLARISAAAREFGMEHRHIGGIDMLYRIGDPAARRAVHLVFAGERVRPEYLEPAPLLGAGRTIRGLKLIPLEDLVRMKLTSFRLKDQAHLKDMDEAALITAEIEGGLSAELMKRMLSVRERE